MAFWDVALIREQGTVFGVASVKDSVLLNGGDAEGLITGLTRYFGCPIVLIGARNHRLLGRRDIVQFLRHVSISQLPWKRYNIS
jgi:hypothetical protein